MSEDCLELTDPIIKQILDKYPISDLPAAIKTEFAKLLPKGSKLCMVAQGDGVQCTKGPREKPESKRCCKFRGDPTVELRGIPDKIKITTGVPPAEVVVVDLTLKGVLSGLTVDKKCVEGDCRDDEASAKALLRIEGLLRLAAVNVTVSINIDLDKKLKIKCDLP